MMPSKALLGSLLLGVTSAASAQQSLCDPCVDPPLYDTFGVPGNTQPQRERGFQNRTTIITAEDMRALGIVSVADMIDQLPDHQESMQPEELADWVQELLQRRDGEPAAGEAPNDSAEESATPLNDAADAEPDQ